VSEWYVVAREPREGDFYVNVFGPFMSETDARAFAIDLADDNGWEYVEAEYITNEQAMLVTTEFITWPYEQSGEED
jgi:hypothetical protein